MHQWCVIWKITALLNQILPSLHRFSKRKNKNVTVGVLIHLSLWVSLFPAEVIQHRVHRSSLHSTPGQRVLSCCAVSFCAGRPSSPAPRGRTRWAYAGAGAKVYRRRTPPGTCNRDQTATRSRRGCSKPRSALQRAGRCSENNLPAVPGGWRGRWCLPARRFCAGSSPRWSSAPSRHRCAWARSRCTCTAPPAPAPARTQTGPERSPRCRSRAQCNIPWRTRSPW